MSDDRWLSLTHDRDDGWIVQPHPTRDAAEARVAEWLEECGAWAATQGDGWPEEMDAYVVSVAAALRETSWEDEETGEPFAEYRMETVPDDRDARIAELEAEVERLRSEAAALAVVRQEHAAVTDLLTADDALCRLGFVEAFEVLKARADEAVDPDPHDECRAEGGACQYYAQDAPAGERQPTPEPPRDPRHITAESERVPTHDDIDRHPRPVEMAEAVLGVGRWRPPYWHEDRPSKARIDLHALLDGRRGFPDGAPGWGAWEWGKR